jgi:hypothetical protein
VLRQIGEVLSERPADLEKRRELELGRGLDPDGADDADALSGRFIHVLDDVHELVRRSKEIQQDNLYDLRLRK